MSKINHTRPALRMIDSFRREFRRQSYADQTLTSNDHQYGIANTMPKVVNSRARETILRMLDAMSKYYNAMSDWLNAHSPNSTKNLQKKCSQMEDNLNHAESDLSRACLGFLIEAAEAHQRGEKDVSEWYSWFQKNTDKDTLNDIEEIGINPVFAKMMQALDQ